MPAQHLAGLLIEELRFRAVLSFQFNNTAKAVSCYLVSAPIQYDDSFSKTSQYEMKHRQRQTAQK